MRQFVIQSFFIQVATICEKGGTRGTFPMITRFSVIALREQSGNNVPGNIRLSFSLREHTAAQRCDLFPVFPMFPVIFL